jgi:hypothetical protein
MTYRLSPRLKELAKWTKLANNGARWALLNTRDEVVAWGRYLSDYTPLQRQPPHRRQAGQRRRGDRPPH